MKGTALLDTMAQQVIAKCDSILREAREEADRIQAKARNDAEEKRNATIASAQSAIDAQDARSRQKAEAEASKADLVVKNEAVEAVLASVEAEVRKLAEGTEFPGLLESMLSELMAVAEGDVVVLGPEKHLDTVKGWLANNGRGDVPVEASPGMWDGVAVQDPKRTYRISNTLSGRFRAVREDARKQCMLGLFGTTQEGAS